MKPCPLALLLTAAFAGGVAAQTYDPLAGGPPPAAAQAGAWVQAQTAASAPPAAPPPGFNTTPAFDPYGAKPVGPPIQRDRSRITRLIEVVDGTPRYERLSDWPHEQFDSGQSAMLAMNYSDNLPVDAGMDNPRTTGGPISGVEVPFHYLVKFWDDYPNAKERAGEVPELGVVSNEIVMGWGSGSAPDNVPADVMADLMHKAGVIRDAIYAYPSIQRSEGVVTRLRIFADVQRDPAGNQVYGFWLRFAFGSIHSNPRPPVQRADGRWTADPMDWVTLSVCVNCFDRMGGPSGRYRDFQLMGSTILVDTLDKPMWVPKFATGEGELIPNPNSSTRCGPRQTSRF